MPTATLVESVTVYDDIESTSNPQRKHVDWKRTATGLVFDQVFSERFPLAPGATRTLEAGVGVSDLTASPVTMVAFAGKATWYRFSGGFATPWALNLGVAAQAIAATLNDDYSLTLTGAGLASLAAVKPGDWVYLAGTQYGDTGPWTAGNQGFYEVVTVGTTLTIRRVFGEDALPVAEIVTTAAVTDIQHIPSATRPRYALIQGGIIFAGLKTVVAAAAGWVAIATETQFTPTAAYTFSRFTVTPKYLAFLRVESDQPVTVQVGDVAGTNGISLVPPSDTIPAWHEGFAFATSLALANNGGATATLNVVYAVKE